MFILYIHPVCFELSDVLSTHLVSEHIKMSAMFRSQVKPECDEHMQDSRCTRVMRRRQARSGSGFQTARPRALCAAADASGFLPGEEAPGGDRPVQLCPVRPRIPSSTMEGTRGFRAFQKHLLNIQ